MKSIFSFQFFSKCVCVFQGEGPLVWQTTTQKGKKKKKMQSLAWWEIRGYKSSK